MKHLNDEDPLTLLGQNIKSKRQEANISQEELARICDMDRTYISLIERGKRNISFINLLKIAKGLNTDLTILTKGIQWH